MDEDDFTALATDAIRSEDKVYVTRVYGEGRLYDIYLTAEPVPDNLRSDDDG